MLSGEPRHKTNVFASWISVRCHRVPGTSVTIRVVPVIILLLVWIPGATAFGQTDEIQVYDGGLADKGKLNLTVHNNFTPIGQKTQPFPGSLVADRSFNGVPEWAYRVTDWFEAGLYMPLYSFGKNRGALIDGAKIRLLFAAPGADDRTFFYGANFEFSYNSKHWNSKRLSSEIRPIVGWHLRPVDLIFNPIVDTDYDGFGNLDFAPATRVAYNLRHRWALAIEEYADYGHFRKFQPRSEQSHQLFFVADHDTKFISVEAGIGVGLTSGSDRLALKLILSRNLN